jgi:transcriptional regulator with XRE-family HTH domain
MAETGMTAASLTHRGHAIVLARTALRMTQRELAARSGVYPPRLCLIEKGRYVPSADELRKIWEALSS